MKDVRLTCREQIFVGRLNNASLQHILDETNNRGAKNDEEEEEVEAEKEEEGMG